MSFESRAIRLERAHGRAGADDMVVTVAADFLHGGEPSFARVFDRRGSSLLGLQRLRDEPWRAFETRAKMEAGKFAGGCSLLMGGLPDGDGEVCKFADLPVDDLPRGAITLPEAALHPSQVEAFKLVRANRRVALVAGRRWGKSSLLNKLAVDAALSGRRAGVFAPTYALMSPLMKDVADALQTVPGVSVNRSVHEIRLPNGGHVDFWSVDYTGRAGRGRKYHIALLDEAAHDEGYLTDAFPTAIAPTLLDFDGSIVAASTPNGLEGWFHDIVHDGRHGFVVHHAPTSANPYWSPEGIDVCGRQCGPEEASQELDALFTLKSTGSLGTEGETDSMVEFTAAPPGYTRLRYHCSESGESWVDRQPILMWRIDNLRGSPVMVPGEIAVSDCLGEGVLLRRGGRVAVLGDKMYPNEKGWVRAMRGAHAATRRRQFKMVKG